MYKNMDTINSSDGFVLSMSMDCEGYNFDKNLRENILNLEKFLDINSSAGIYTALFITPHFAEMLYREKIVEKLKKYLVFTGLHIHPEDFPDEIREKCSFELKDELITSYNFNEKCTMVKNSMDYLHKRGIEKIEGFRGGYFSIDDELEEAIRIEAPSIIWESHNIYRSQYKVSNKILKCYPVYAKNEIEEFRLEYFDTRNLIRMLNGALLKNEKVLGITHSYLLEYEEIHGKMRDIIKYLKESGVI